MDQLIQDLCRDVAAPMSRYSPAVLFHENDRWDDCSVREMKAEAPRERGHHQEGSVGSPTTQQMRTVGQRRREAEEKLQHHLQEAKEKPAED